MKKINIEGRYFYVTSNGLIKSAPFIVPRKDGSKHKVGLKIIKQSVTKEGYARVKLNGKQFYVHRLVAIYFIENDGIKPEVNHIDGNKLNNKIDNLEWVSRRENIKHAMENNLYKKYEEHPLNKFLFTCEEINGEKLTALEFSNILSEEKGFNNIKSTTSMILKRNKAHGYKFLKHKKDLTK